MADGKIKQIRTTDGKLYDIQAVYLGEYTAEQWESMIHGSIETYVIPGKRGSGCICIQLRQLPLQCQGRAGTFGASSHARCGICISAR